MTTPATEARLRHVGGCAPGVLLASFSPMAWIAAAFSLRRAAHEVLGEEGVYVGQLIIGGRIIEGDEERDPPCRRTGSSRCTPIATRSATGASAD